LWLVISDELYFHALNGL